MQKLLDAILFPGAVHVGDLVLGDRGEVEVNLKQRDSLKFLPVKTSFFSGLFRLLSLLAEGQNMKKKHSGQIIKTC